MQRQPQPQQPSLHHQTDNHSTTMGDTISVCRFEEGYGDNSTIIEMTRHSSLTTTIPLLELEGAVRSYFRYDDNNDDNNNNEDEDPTPPAATDEEVDEVSTTTPPEAFVVVAPAASSASAASPLQIFPRNDSHWLNCRRPNRMISTVFGVEEELDIPNDILLQLGQDPAYLNPDIHVEVYQAATTTDSCGSDYDNYNNNNYNYNNNHYNNDHNHSNHSTNGSSRIDSSCSCRCGCQAPHLDWRLHERSFDTATTSSSTSTSSSSSPTLLRWMDFRLWQREHHAKEGEEFLNSPAAVTHFLRSVLGSTHDSSIWVTSTNHHHHHHHCDHAARDDVSRTISRSNVSLLLPGVVAVLLTHASSHLTSFRVGDACPSFYLHSVTQLQQIPWDDAQWWMQRSWQANDDDDDDHHHHQFLSPLLARGRDHDSTTRGGDATLLVYRRLAPRDQLSIFHPKDPQAFPTPKGCLWETYYCYIDHDDDDDDDDNDDDEEEEEEEEEQYRLVAPPYISCDECYPGVLDPLLTPASLAIMRQEALSIAHWTAWPEKQHYRSHSADVDVDAASATTTTYPASWTVFPLCYCFPANDASALTWIPKTCRLVPGTASLLQQHVGKNSYLRTALFSRLDPETTLEPHIGWADLANHVLRVHIPLVVPQHGGGLCGTWVDGCVETHEEGRLICLDDSKLHRAFNYAKQPRIVLIVDLARPPSLPLGTATGGHSDELDKFIEQMGGES